MAGIGILVLGSGVSPAAAAASPGRSRCIAELARAGVFGHGVNPGTANIVAGTEGDDRFGTTQDDPGQLTDGVDLVCGFGGSDLIDCCTPGGTASFGNGDVFLGGDGSDMVSFLGEGGTFIGGAGENSVSFMFSGSTFEGGPTSDTVGFNEGGTFNGGEGDDLLSFLNMGTFNGGGGNDHADFVNDGTYNGDAGDDSVFFLLGGTFNGGPGEDSVVVEAGGTFNQ